jgi:hypothetical protein
MGDVDFFDGEKMRREWGAPQAQEGKSQDEKSSRSKDEDDLLHIHPVLDGRFNDIGRA